MKIGLDEARALDARDPLARFRAEAVVQHVEIAGASLEDVFVQLTQRPEVQRG